MTTYGSKIKSSLSVICTPKRISLIVFSLWFIVGVFIFRDYGISTDETTERETSLVNYVFVMKKAMLYSDSDSVRETAIKTPELRDYRDRYYGVALQTITTGIEHLFRFELTSKTVFLIRHWFTFLNYFIAGIFFYLILKKRFENDYIPLIGTLLYILYPRFFGESFYNIKDILFYSWTVIASYFILMWLEEKSNKYCILSALAIAVSMNTRILGISLLMLACFFAVIKSIDEKTNFLKVMLKLVLLIVLTFTLYVIITPYLWEAPLKHFIETFNHFLHFPNWEGTHFYLGRMITKDVPWHYIPVWMGVSVPITYIVMFISGIIVFFLNFKISRSQRKNKNFIEGLKEKNQK